MREGRVVMREGRVVMREGRVVMREGPSRVLKAGCDEGG